MERRLRMKYRQQIDDDARELVQLGATVCSDQDGELLLSTNSDMFAVGEDKTRLWPINTLSLWLR